MRLFKLIRCCLRPLAGRGLYVRYIHTVIIDTGIGIVVFGSIALVSLHARGSSL